MAVRQVSMTPARVCWSWPERLRSSSRLRRVAASMRMASSGCSAPMPSMWGRAPRWVSPVSKSPSAPPAGDFETGDTEAGQVPGAELLAQEPCRGLAVEVPGRPAAGTGATGQPAWHAALLVVEDLGWLQTLDLRRQRTFVRHLAHQEAPGGEIQPGDADLAAG